MPTPRIALVSREVYPLGGGGIAEYIAACAQVLASWSEVTIFTTSTYRDRYVQLCGADQSSVLPDGVQVVFVPEAHPQEQGGFFSTSHLYSSRIFDALRQFYGARGPDLVEFSDYLGEGAVTAQARRAGVSFMRKTTVAVRLHTTAEVCSILDGHLDDDWHVRVLCELERRALADCDYLIWPGGDTLPFYHRFYGARNIAPGYLIKNPALWDAEPVEDSSHDEAAALRLLYLGRLERRKGVHNLVRALNCLDSDRVFLDLLGGDTNTAPLGKSMGDYLRIAAANDSRIRFIDRVPRDELKTQIKASDAIVLPSLWEAWPYVGLEALRLNRPIIATPVGGFTEMVRHGHNGWLTSDTSVASLTDLLERLSTSVTEVQETARRCKPLQSFSDLTDSTLISSSYRALLAQEGRWRQQGTSAAGRRSGAIASRNADDSFQGKRTTARLGRKLGSLVSIVVPYYRAAQYVHDTVRSALEQTYAPIELVIVNDGSDGEDDWVLAELATIYPMHVVTQMNSGLGAARNFGVSQARGRFIVPLDADDVLDPAFVERTVEAFEYNPTAAYVTSWTQYVDEEGQPLAALDSGYQPLGNQSREVLRNNVAGSATSLIPRWTFDSGFKYDEELTSYEDWHFYQQLHRAARYGIVIPERLMRYRVRSNSMIRRTGFPHTGRLAGELQSHLLEKETAWQYKSD